MRVCCVSHVCHICCCRAATWHALHQTQLTAEKLDMPVLAVLFCIGIEKAHFQGSAKPLTPFKGVTICCTVQAPAHSCQHLSQHQLYTVAHQRLCVSDLQMFHWTECSSDPPLLVPGTIQLPGSCRAVCPQLSQGKYHDY